MRRYKDILWEQAGGDKSCETLAKRRVVCVFTRWRIMHEMSGLDELNG